ncbi:MAG: MBL fold metallo-hydrolase [Bacteroidaceae bacterium]|nr:MBL fold metallo-hydrolase [Bacteroidaceae bacterium]
MKKGIIPTILLSLFAVAAQAQSDVNSRDLRGDIVYQDDEVVFRKLDDHTWIGNGHRLYNESLYLVEGNKSAVLIDAGVRIPELDKIVAKITSKPITMILTHGHGDHVGGAGPFPEVWVSPADEQMFLSNLRGYQGKTVHLTDGQIIDLGDRKLEVMFTPGHTAGSVTFFDKANHYGFSGDAFGSTNLLVFTYLSNVVASAAKVEKYIKENNIKFLFPGHYSGDNLETPQRVTDIKEMCQEVLDGKRQPIKSDGNNGGNDLMIDDKGVRITFSSRSGIK